MSQSKLRLFDWPKFKQVQAQSVEVSLAEPPASKGLYTMLARSEAKAIGEALRDGSMNLLLIIYVAC